MKLPRLGLAAQLTLLTAVLVIIAQVINATLLVSLQQNVRMQRAEFQVVDRVTEAAQTLEAAPALERRVARRSGFAVRSGPLPGGEPMARAEALLTEALIEVGLEDRLHQVRRYDRRRPAIVASVQLADGRWVSSMQPIPKRAGLPVLVIIIQTAVLTALLVLPAIYISRRVAKPLRQLTAAADGMITGKPAPNLPTGGPPDVEALCQAFQSLESRVLAALEERSMMLGAVGHDLRTPLASLRIRVESVDDDQLREEMIESIEGLSAALDDILQFSKGIAHEAREALRTDALARGLARDYPGEQLVLGEIEAASLICAPQAVLRALRNLIDNALRYAGRAELEITTSENTLRLSVLDRGPGLPPQELERLTKPFARGEQSRSRKSGGAGLGLAIAQAVAEAHDGQLVLENRPGGGLAASLSLPMTAEPLATK